MQVLVLVLLFAAPCTWCLPLHSVVQPFSLNGDSRLLVRRSDNIGGGTHKIENQEQSKPPQIIVTSQQDTVTTNVIEANSDSMATEAHVTAQSTNVSPETKASPEPLVSQEKSEGKGELPVKPIAPPKPAGDAELPGNFALPKIPKPRCSKSIELEGTKASAQPTIPSNEPTEPANPGGDVTRPDGPVEPVSVPDVKPEGGAIEKPAEPTEPKSVSEVRLGKLPISEGGATEKPPEPVQPSDTFEKPAEAETI